MGQHQLATDLENAHMPASGKSLNIPGVGWLLSWGNTVPANASTGYAKGGLFIHTDGSSADDLVYQNNGSTTSSTFEVITSVSGSDFGSASPGLLVDVIAESTSATGVTLDSVLLKDGSVTAGATGSVSVPGTGSIGYATGSGGAVAQATNKATGVTLSKTNGTITMDAAALAAAAEVTFIVTNTLVAVTDVIVLSIQSGGTPGEYQATVSTVAAGSFHITLANLSGSSASDAVLINFAVIKAVVA